LSKSFPRIGESSAPKRFGVAGWSAIVL
jgi:hypothetical protein